MGKAKGPYIFLPGVVRRGQVHAAEEQKKIAAGKHETFRTVGILEAIRRRYGVVTFPTALN